MVFTLDKRTFRVGVLPFVQDDGGRSTSKRPKQKNDCAVRSVAIAFNQPYDEVYDHFAKEGRKCSGRFHFKHWASFQPNLKWRSFPAVKGEKRMNPSRFCLDFPSGTWIVNTAKHVFVVVNGVIHDDAVPRPDRCVYGAWQVVNTNV